MERESWEVRDGNERDMEGILSLRRIVFGEMEEDKLDPRFWRWEFTEGPDGKAFTYVIEDGERVVGHFADLPRRFSLRGKVVLGTVSIDLMVHPDFRRRGFFLKMGRYAAECVRKNQGSFMASFPIRRETINGFARLGWKAVSRLPVLVYPIRFSNIVNHYLPFRFLSFLIGAMARLLHLFLYGSMEGKRIEGVEVDEVSQWDDRFDQFWEKARSLYPIMGVRSQPYFEWRYFRHPTRTYVVYRAMKREEMRGYVIMRKVDLLGFNSAVIVDLLALDDSALMALVKSGIEHSRGEGVDLVGCMLPKGHEYEKNLRQMGFLPSMKNFLLMVYPCDEEGGLLRSKDWYVNWGDTDVI